MQNGDSDEALEGAQRRFAVVFDVALREDASVEAPEHEASDQQSCRVADVAALVRAQRAVQQPKPDEDDQAGSARQHHQQADENRRVHVPATQRGRAALLADSGPVACGDSIVEGPEGAQNECDPRCLDGGFRTGSRSAHERDVNGRADRAAIQDGPQIIGDCVVERDRRADRHHEASPVDIQAAYRGRSLRRIAMRVAAREPEVHAPNDERDQRRGGGACQRAPAGVSVLIVQNE